VLALPSTVQKENYKEFQENSSEKLCMRFQGPFKKLLLLEVLPILRMLNLSGVFLNVSLSWVVQFGREKLN